MTNRRLIRTWKSEKDDICKREICERVLQDIQVVFHLAGIKGSIGVAQKKAARF